VNLLSSQSPLARFAAAVKIQAELAGVDIAALAAELAGDREEQRQDGNYLTPGEAMQLLQTLDCERESKLRTLFSQLRDAMPDHQKKWMRGSECVSLSAFRPLAKSVLKIQQKHSEQSVDPSPSEIAEQAAKIRGEHLRGKSRSF
jgi:hypothetical protein